MSDRILIPLPGIGTLELTRAQYEAALRPIAAPAPSNAVVVPTGTNELLDAKAVARALSLPTSWVREKARQGEIPCMYAGRYVRFNLAAVQKALAPTDQRSIGHR
jgi:hypothetical protein